MNAIFCFLIPLVAAAERLHGSLLLTSGRYEEAAALLEDAFTRARAAGADEEFISAALDLSAVESRLADHEQSPWTTLQRVAVDGSRRASSGRDVRGPCQLGNLRAWALLTGVNQREFGPPSHL